MNLFGAEAGVDIRTYQSKTSRWIVGAMGGYLATNDIRVRQDNQYDGRGSATSPNVGLYGTYWHTNGWFADMVARYFWSTVKMRNVSAAGQPISYDTNRDFITASVEVGKRFLTMAPHWAQMPSENGRSVIRLEPKVEIQYAHAGSDSLTTNFGDRIKYNPTNSLTTRLAMAAIYLPYNLDSKYKPFVEIGVSNEWLGKTNINFAGAPLTSNVGGAGFDISAGLDINLSNQTYFYGDVTYEVGSVYRAISGNIGIRYRF